MTFRTYKNKYRPDEFVRAQINGSLTEAAPYVSGRLFDPSLIATLSTKIFKENYELHKLEKVCHSCQELAEIEEGEWDCQECKAEFAKKEAHYRPIYEGEIVAGFHIKE